MGGAEFEILRVAGIAAKGQQAEEGAEDVLALGDPDDRLDAQGMKGKESGGQGAAPESAGDAFEEKEEQDGVGRMQEQAGEMMAGRAQLVELAIGHVREPGQGQPVAGAGGGEGPFHAGPGQALLNERVVGDIDVVVEIDEAALQGGPKSGQDGASQQQGNGPGSASATGFCHGRAS